jgi:hypothetical protein
MAAICERLDVHPKTVRKWIGAGTPESVDRFVGEWRVAEDDFAEFERNAQFSPPTPSTAPNRAPERPERYPRPFAACRPAPHSQPDSFSPH